MYEALHDDEGSEELERWKIIGDLLDSIAIKNPKNATRPGDTQESDTQEVSEETEDHTELDDDPFDRL